MPRAWVQIAAGAAAAFMLALLAHAATPRPRPPAPLPAPLKDTPAPAARKSDRLPLAFADRVIFPEPPAALPLSSVHLATDICTRHKGWKVITDGGRSWHCAYR
jgi:hypothetical protein